jgi:putative membrane protein
MNRREAARMMMFGAVGAVAATGLPAIALAQGTAEMGEAEQRHATETLKVGSLALMSSDYAKGKLTAPRAKEFAQFEIDEQTTIAQIIKESAGLAPPPPDAEAKATMAKLEAARGKALDTAYVQAQTDGHQKLLAIQERYLSEGRNPHMRHVAMLARGQIKEHLKLLADIRAGRA